MSPLRNTKFVSILAMYYCLLDWCVTANFSFSLCVSPESSGHDFLHGASAEKSLVASYHIVFWWMSWHMQIFLVSHFTLLLSSRLQCGTPSLTNHPSISVLVLVTIQCVAAPNKMPKFPCCGNIFHWAMLHSCMNTIWLLCLHRLPWFPFASPDVCQLFCDPEFLSFLNSGLLT